MNKRVLILVIVFLACCGFVLHAEKEGILVEKSQVEQEHVVQADPVEILEEQRHFKASEKTLDEQLLHEMFQEVTDYTPPNNELQIYMAGQTEFDGNRCMITADRQGEQYLSGKLESKTAFRYGTMTFQVETVYGTGLFPAIWMMPSEGNPFPELDVYELIGSEPELFYGVLHYYKNDTRKRNFFQHRFSKDEIPDSYEVKFVWTPDELSWYLDGELIHTIIENVPQVPMYLNINLAVGGIWPGDPDETTQFPAFFTVDILEIDMQEVYSR